MASGAGGGAGAAAGNSSDDDGPVYVPHPSTVPMSMLFLRILGSGDNWAIEFPGYKDNTIGDVKRYVSYRFALPVKEQRILCDAVDLDNSVKVADTRLTYASCVYLRIPFELKTAQQEALDAAREVYRKAQEAAKEAIERAEKSDGVPVVITFQLPRGGGRVRWTMEFVVGKARLGVPIEMQTMLCMGKELKNDEKLDDLDLTSGTVLHMMVPSEYSRPQEEMQYAWKMEAGPMPRRPKNPRKAKKASSPPPPPAVATPKTPTAAELAAEVAKAKAREPTKLTLEVVKDARSGKSECAKPVAVGTKWEVELVMDDSPTIYDLKAAIHVKYGPPPASLSVALHRGGLSNATRLSSEKITETSALRVFVSHVAEESMYQFRIVGGPHCRELGVQPGTMWTVAGVADTGADLKRLIKHKFKTGEADLHILYNGLAVTDEDEMQTLDIDGETCCHLLLR